MAKPAPQQQSSWTNTQVTTTMAVVTCLSPGFILNVAKVDTISYPAVTGFAALTFVGAYLAGDDNRRHRKAVVFGVLLLFMLMNWSTLFSLFVMVVYVGCKRPPGKKLVLFAGAALFLGLLVFAASMASRHQGGTTSSGFWNAYLMGPGGYDGQGMNWNKALVRITGVNIIAWLPVLLAGLAWLFCNGRGERSRWAPLPLLAGILAVLAMRNYNAHHPWGATSIIGLGLVFTLELALAPHPRSKTVVPAAGLALSLAFSLFYAVSWLALDEFNHREENALWNLLSQHTPRHSLIVMDDDFLPAGQLNVSRMAGQFDRKVIAQSEWNRAHDQYARSDRECFLLTHATLAEGGHPLVARSVCQPGWADQIMVPLFDFYRSKISRRSTGDRMVFFKECQLYKL